MLLEPHPNKKMGLALFVWECKWVFKRDSSICATRYNGKEKDGMLVTGAANGALAGYLALEKLLPAGEQHHLVIGQGHAIDRPGTLYVTVDTTGQDPVVRVAGAAHVTIAGLMRV
ncbi:PhzF family phenazine biosynthesis protein [Brevibacillus agri]|nr:PhzF family phenazine biosynthesis protein [Brevibacillus agri]